MGQEHSAPSSESSGRSDSSGPPSLNNSGEETAGHWAVPNPMPQASHKAKRTKANRKSTESPSPGQGSAKEVKVHVGGLDDKNGGYEEAKPDDNDDSDEVYSSVIDPNKRKTQAVVTAASQFSSLINLDNVAEIAWKDLTLDLDKPLGSGAFGVVYKGTLAGQPVAVKQLKGLNPEQLAEFKREAQLMHTIGTHSNIITLIGICTEPGRFAIIMPLYPKGSVYDLVAKSKTHLEYQQILKIAMDAAEGIAYLHSNRLIHRDIAARNIFLSDDFTGVVGDFSMSRILTASGAFGKTQSVFGPVKWMAPECIQHQQYSYKTDSYSFAMLLVELLTHDEPYGSDVKIKTVLPAVLRGDRPQLPPSVPKELRELIEECWRPNPNDRPSFKEITKRLKGMYGNACAKATPPGPTVPTKR